MSNPFSIANTRIRRSPYQAIAAVSIITMTLFLAGIFFIIAAASHAVLKHFESQPQVIGYFKTDYEPKETELSEIKTNLSSLGVVNNVQYTSKEEALKLYSKSSESSPLLLVGVTSSLLPASIEVSAKNPKDLVQIAEVLKKIESISTVQFPEDIIAPFVKWTSSLRVIGGALVGTHVLITFLIILLIMSVKVVNRKDEITTFKLLGATTGYVSLPFVIEGFMYGVVGGFISWGLAYLSILYTMGFWVSFLSGFSILPPPLWFMLSVLLGLLVLGGFIGGLGASVAVHRFLKR